MTTDAFENRLGVHLHRPRAGHILHALRLDAVDAGHEAGRVVEAEGLTRYELLAYITNSATMATAMMSSDTLIQLHGRDPAVSPVTPLTTTS